MLFVLLVIILDDCAGAGLQGDCQAGACQYSWHIN